MATVKSKWATAAALTGTFSPGEWTVSGVLPMPGGLIHAKTKRQGCATRQSCYAALQINIRSGIQPNRVSLPPADDISEDQELGILHSTMVVTIT